MMTWDEKDSHLEANEKKKNELPQVGFEPTTLFTPDRCSYQLSYQGSPAGWVQIKHLIHLCEQVNWNYMYMYV